MSTFFQQTAQAMIAKHVDRFPLLKLDQVIDWQPIEQKPIANIRCRKRKPNATDICRRPVM